MTVFWRWRDIQSVCELLCAVSLSSLRSPATNAARISKRRLIDLAKEAFIFGRMSVIALHHRKLDLGYHNGTHSLLGALLQGGIDEERGLGLCSSTSWAEG